MLVNEIVGYLYSLHINDFVVEDDLCHLLDDTVGKEANIVSITDIRSAAFYALGLSQKKDVPVVIVLRREYLSNTFTALTESWFQRRGIIVIAIGNNILNDSLDCYKNCSCVQHKVQKFGDFTSCFENIRLDLPVIFLMEGEYAYNPIKGSVDINSIANEIPGDIHLFVYSALIDVRRVYSNVSYIDPEFKYGMLSKFLGHCISNKEKSILITDISILKLDMNIFNSRYLDERFNMIVTGQKPSAEILHWIRSNGINISFCDSVIEAVRAVCKSNKSEVVFLVNKEE